MADKLVIKNPKVKINNTTLTAWDGSDISAYVDSVIGNFDITEVDGTASGDGAKNNEAGLEDNKVQLVLKEALLASALNGIIWPLRGTKIFMAFRLKDAAISPDNEEYQFKVLVAGAYPVGGQVNTIATKNLTWNIVTTVTRDTTP